VITVEIRKARFFAYHGVYEEERKTGNEFEVNLVVTHAIKKKKIKSLSETLNYVRLYELVNEEMKKPRDLLEMLAMEITEKIKSEFSQVKEIQITIIKLHPPIVNFLGDTAVTYRKRF
jgi:dihydroneopterin aldolase